MTTRDGAMKTQMENFLAVKDEDFRGKVKAYQTDGNRTIINEILWAVGQDFMSNPTRRRDLDSPGRSGVSLVLEKNEHYIAYRMRAMRELITWQFEGRLSDVYIHEIMRLLSIIRIDLRIEFTAEVYKSDPWIEYYNLTPELFAELEGKMPEIEDKMNPDTFPIFNRLFYRYKEIVEMKQLEKSIALPKIEKSLEEALEHGLKYVDTTRTEREMVKYINKAFSSKFSDLELERNGLTRIQRNDRYGTRKIMHVDKHFPQDLTRVLFGKSLEDFRSVLTKDQSDFADKAMEIIYSDAINGNINEYTCDVRGEARVRKSYIAGKLGLDPATVRKRMTRIIKRIE